MKTKNKGFTLLELLLSFAIILVAAIVAFYIYPKVKANSEASIENSNLSVLQTGIKTLYQSKSNYIGLNSKVLLDAMLVPNTMVSGNFIVNTWKAIVFIGVSSEVNFGDSYIIVYTDVPQISCVKIISGVSDNFKKITVGYSAVVKDTKEGLQDLNMALVTESCKAGGNFNMIQFVGN